ncbi:MAG: hypothetical protein ABIJ10_02455 [Candidatus Micrarchaeota archaeon]|nr:hypothetical protein [Candidatus Micrarchaeota archaeon]
MHAGSLVVFEKLDSHILPKIRYHIDRGDIVYFFGEIPPDLEKKLSIYLNDRRLIHIWCGVVSYQVALLAWRYAHSKFDAVFDKHFSQSRIIKNSITLFGDDKIVDMYRYAVFQKFARACLNAFIVNTLQSNSKCSKCFFYSSDDLHFYSNSYTDLKSEIQFIKTNSIISTVVGSLKKLLYLFHPFYLLLKKIGSISLNIKKTQFPVAININHPMPIFSMNYYTEIIMLDDQELPKKEVLFLDESPKKVNVNDYKKENCIFTLVNDSRLPISWWKLNFLFVRLIPAICKSFLNICEPEILLYTNAKAMSDFVLWNIICENFQFRNYIRWYLPDNVSKILVLRKHGVKTWYTYPDFNTALEYDVVCDRINAVNPTYTMMHYDIGVFYGNKVSELTKHHKNSIDCYINNGILFSQVDQEIKLERLKTPLKKILEKKGFFDKKIIGVFDTNFEYRDIDPLDFNDGKKFLGDVLKLLDEFPDTAMILKAKKQRSEYTPALSSLYDKIQNHERGLVFYKYSREGISAPEVIAYSDFVITAPFSSTTIEALGAGKRAIYYDPNNTYGADTFYYNQFPNLVAGSYNELKRLFKYWAYKVNDEQFKAYLDRYIRYECDPYLDMKALSRLRKMLRTGVVDEYCASGIRR